MGRSISIIIIDVNVMNVISSIIFYIDCWTDVKSTYITSLIIKII